MDCSDSVTARVRPWGRAERHTTLQSCSKKTAGPTQEAVRWDLTVETAAQCEAKFNNLEQTWFQKVEIVILNVSGYFHIE